MKRLFMISGMLSTLGLLGMTSYAVRELIAALILITVAFAVLLLITLAGVFVYRFAQEGARLFALEAREWSRTGRDWMLELAPSMQGRHLWQKWTHTLPAPVVPSPDGD